VPQSALDILCCINPDCAQPIQTWGNKFCQGCGSALQLHDRYLPLKRLGSGGFAVTYTVFDLRSQSERVLKVLTETAPKAIELFEQEAQVLTSLSHPGVPHVEPGSCFQVQVGGSTGRSLPCLVMEKINGQTLQDLVEQHPQGCPEAWVVDWLQQAIDILKVLHQRQIIHRDLKPENVMLRQKSGQLVLIDFGGAKQMRPLLPFAQASSTRLVSPGYSPPEQIAGGGIQPASDFYALGRTMIHLLTGRYPSELEDPTTGDLRWRSCRPFNPALANLLDDLVQPDVRQRPAAAEAIQIRLAPIAATLAVRAGTATPNVQSQAPQSHALIDFQQGFKAIKRFGNQISIALWRMLVWVLKAVLDTVWSMLLSGIGASLGTALGFAIAYQTGFGTDLAAGLSRELSQLLPDRLIVVGPEFLIFAIAGLGTAWGLTAAGGFAQRRQIWISATMGIFGYLLGWTGLQVTRLDGAVVGLSLFAAIAPALLTMGLGLPRGLLPYEMVAALGIAPWVALLTVLNPEFATSFWQHLLTPSTATWFSLIAYLSLFGLLGSWLAACLGFCHYLLIPFLRWINWY
jgi:hypothetical protein